MGGINENSTSMYDDTINAFEILHTLTDCVCTKEVRFKVLYGGRDDTKKK